MYYLALDYEYGTGVEQNDAENGIAKLPMKAILVHSGA